MLPNWLLKYSWFRRALVQCIGLVSHYTDGIWHLALNERLMMLLTIQVSAKGHSSQGVWGQH